jgi:hypothetical protein
MELIHIDFVRTRHVHSINNVHRLNMGVKSKKLFRLLKSMRTAKGAQKLLMQVVRGSKLVEPIGIEPMTSCLQSRRSPN